MNTINPPGILRRPAPPGHITAVAAEQKYGVLARKASTWASQGRLPVIKQGRLCYYDEAQLARRIEAQREIEASRESERENKRRKPTPGETYQVWWGTSFELPTLKEAREYATKAAKELKRDVVINTRKRWNHRVTDTPIEVVKYEEASS